jgi:hypothetical protein
VWQMWAPLQLPGASSNFRLQMLQRQILAKMLGIFARADSLIDNFQPSSESGLAELIFLSSWMASDILVIIELRSFSPVQRSASSCFDDTESGGFRHISR